jgi:hypothetical protein
MLCVRLNVAVAALAVALFLPVSAGAQYYYTPSPEPAPRGFNRVVVTDAPMPPDLGRPYPYVANGQPNYTQFGPEPRRHVRSHVSHRAPKTTNKPMMDKKLSAKPTGNMSKRKVDRAERAALIEELKKRPRIKQVTIEDAGTSPRIENIAPRKDKRASLAGGERVIRAEAEVRIMGNDQMSIRLYRRGTSPRASAE